MNHGYFKDLTRRTALDRVLKDKAFNIAKYPKHDGRCVNNEIKQNQQLAGELQKPIIRTF